jgi:hypothetical protein
LIVFYPNARKKNGENKRNGFDGIEVWSGDTFFAQKEFQHYYSDQEIS